MSIVATVVISTKVVTCQLVDVHQIIVRVCVTIQSVGHMAIDSYFEGGEDYDNIIMLTSHMTPPDSTPHRCRRRMRSVCL